MKRSQLDLHRFEKVLALLDSAVEGEAIAALGRAKHMLAGADVSFRELKVGISSSQGSTQEPVQAVDTAQVQRLEQELESLRWSLARHELQVAALRQSVEEKSAVIQIEQAKRHAQEGELVGLRKAHAVQMEEALNRKEDVERLTRELALYQSFEKETGVGPKVALRQRMKNNVGVKSDQSRKVAQKTGQEISPVGARRRRGGVDVVASVTSEITKMSSENDRPDRLEQAAFNLVGGEDRSVGKEYRWARLEDRHQVMAAVVEAGNDEAVPVDGGKGSDTSTLKSSELDMKTLNALELAMGLRAEA
ncbi:hypothetical protein WH96_04270 [Kiloniella spongiae]|uniref:Uncharacterized protein n=1 Tax=Kiloniella spongiae TaxID=1489064 RepID=A0A0H2MLG5_9PROT|nr:hypothetical protein [Kiloniella spongiae]KLN61577.1 hypothetical protein WH96_04270 [Kiloniella spongiae]